MNKFRFYFIVFSSIMLLFSSCKKDELEELQIEPLRDATVQKNADELLLEKYMKSHYIESISSNFDISIKPLLFKPIGTTKPSIYSLLNATSFPKLLIKDVIYEGVSYRVHYLVLQEGLASKKPSVVDNLWISYNGKAIADTEIVGNTGVFAVGTQFDNVDYPTQLFQLYNLIQGWKEIIPLFGGGNQDLTVSPNEPVSFSNFGAGVMFIPSGLAYFNQARVSIPAYSPLVFTFKLLDINLADQDNDRINSNDEDLNKNGIFTDDDSDGDGIQNFLDIDDDNDGYPTVTELKKTDGTYYSFDVIPDCAGNSTLPTRIKKHLDNRCN